MDMHENNCHASPPARDDDCIRGGRHCSRQISSVDPNPTMTCVVMTCVDTVVLLEDQERDRAAVDQGKCCISGCDNGP